MNRARLLLLRNVAETLDITQLDMEQWGGCGTFACLAGWACRNKEVNAEGLHASKERDNWGVPQYKDAVGFHALDKFFDIYGFETTHLFGPIAYSAYPTRGELLQHIDDILNSADIDMGFGGKIEFETIPEAA